MKPKIGVMGSCGEPISDHARAMARKLGESIGAAGYALITGASPGLPYEAVLGARSRGGMTVGISPGLSLAEHITKYASPCQGFDVLIYTGSGLMGREVENMQLGHRRHSRRPLRHARGVRNRLRRGQVDRRIARDRRHRR